MHVLTVAMRSQVKERANLPVRPASGHPPAVASACAPRLSSLCLRSTALSATSVPVIACRAARFAMHCMKTSAHVSIAVLTHKPDMPLCHECGNAVAHLIHAHSSPSDGASCALQISRTQPPRAVPQRMPRTHLTAPRPPHSLPTPTHSQPPHLKPSQPPLRFKRCPALMQQQVKCRTHSSLSMTRRPVPRQQRLANLQHRPLRMHRSCHALHLTYPPLITSPPSLHLRMRSSCHALDPTCLPLITPQPS